MLCMNYSYDSDIARHVMTIYVIHAHLLHIYACMRTQALMYICMAYHILYTKTMNFVIFIPSIELSESQQCYTAKLSKRDFFM